MVLGHQSGLIQLNVMPAGLRVTARAGTSSASMSCDAWNARSRSLDRQSGGKPNGFARSRE